MTMLRKVMPAQISALGEDEVQVVVSTGYLARDDHVFEPRGAHLDNYRQNPVVLWNHNTANPPVGRGEDLVVSGDQITARVRFPPPGISAAADEIRGLAKAGFINSVSVGIDPIEAEPLDPKKPRGGQRVRQWELMEFSFCNIPVDTGAVVTARAKTANDVHHQEQAGMTTIAEQHRDLKVRHTRALERAPALKFKRGLYEVAQMAYLMETLGYCHSSSEYEAALEGDDSPVPGMLGEVLTAFVAAFKSAATEEADELLAAHADDEGDDAETRALSDEDRAYIAAGKTPRARAWRKGLAVARAGKALSTTNAAKIADAQGNLDRAMKHHKAIGDHNTAVGEQLAGAQASTGKAQAASGQVAESLAAAKAEPDKAPEHVARAIKAQKTVDGHLGDAADAQTSASDRSMDLGDSHNSLGRSVKSVQRSLRSVVEGSTPGGEDSDVKDVQDVQGGDADTQGSRSHSADFRRRQAEARALAAAAVTVN